MSQRPPVRNETRGKIDNEKTISRLRPLGGKTSLSFQSLDHAPGCRASCENPGYVGLQAGPLFDGRLQGMFCKLWDR